MAFGIDDALGLGAPVVGGILGSIFGNQDQQQAIDAQKAALNGILSVNPQLSSVNFQNYQNAGNFTPEQEQALQQQATEMNNINVDPSLMAAAKQSLSSLQNVANQGGRTIQDQANLNNILSQQGQANAGAQQAIMQSAARRGMGNSGMALANQMNAAQESANRANQAGTNIAAQAQQNALQALMGAGSLGSQLNSQSFNQQAQTANAQDLINKFNTQNSQNVANTNVQNNNAGQMYNLQNAQNIANQNTGLANQQQLQNNQYQQQYYTDQLNKQQAAAQQQNNLANTYTGQAKNTAQTFSGIGQGLGQYGAADAAQTASNNRWDGYVNALQGKKASDDEEGY